MTDRPIIFSAPMVRALLDGRKTQTRRVLKPQPLSVNRVGIKWHDDFLDCKGERLPYAPGDRLWVREAISGRQYAADFKPVPAGVGEQTWFHHRKRDHSPSIHMPRWASRLTLIVTDVRVQRVQEISRDDAIAEGLTLASSAIEQFWRWPEPHHERLWLSPPAAFREIWDGLNAKRGFGWDANPWVVALTFEIHHQNIDQMEREPEGSEA